MLLDTVSIDTFPIAHPTTIVGPTGGISRGFRARELRPQAPNDRIRYFTSCMRLTIASYFGPYLSHTGLTASWKAFLSASETWMIWIPAALAFSIACCS